MRSRGSPRQTSTLPQGFGRLNTQCSARRCGARQYSHGRHRSRTYHRRGEEFRSQTIGAQREEQDEAVAGDDAAAELTTSTGEHGTQHAPGLAPSAIRMPISRVRRCTATAMSTYRPAAEKTSDPSRMPATTTPPMPPPAPAAVRRSPGGSRCPGAAAPHQSAAPGRRRVAQGA